MGHGHDPLPTVPDYKIYKAEDVPELKKLQARLAKHGLKDPWIRNHVWRYHPGWGTPYTRFIHFFFRGFLKVGFPAFLLTVAYRKMVSKDDHGHGHGHGEAHASEHH